MPPDRVKRVPAETIRAIFNNSQYPGLIQTGQLVPQLIKDSMLQDPHQKGEPKGTRSQVIRYLDLSGQWVVVVHQYLRPNGTLGGSGKPDPKRLRIAETIFLVTNE
jgi:hypothetical protein